MAASRQNPSCPLSSYWLQRVHAPGAAHPDRGRWGCGDRPKIPVDEIVTEWREQSSQCRYESAMWRAAGLEEPNAKGAADADAEMEVDNLATGGFFGWMGREQLGAGSVMARA